MRGYELRKARQDRMRELRREAQAALSTGLALDGEALLDLALGSPDGARGVQLSRALKLRGLRALGYTAAELAPRVGMTPAAVEKAATSTLLADPGIAGAIYDQVEAELPETPEPGRAVEPRGDAAVPGMGYPLDPRIVGEGR